jgi:hypothetical protein
MTKIPRSLGTGTLSKRKNGSIRSSDEVCAVLVHGHKHFFRKHGANADYGQK